MPEIESDEAALREFRASEAADDAFFRHQLIEKGARDIREYPNVGIHPEEHVRSAAAGGMIEREDLVAEPDRVPPITQTPVDPTDFEAELVPLDDYTKARPPEQAVGLRVIAMPTLEVDEFWAAREQVTNEDPVRCYLGVKAFRAEVDGYVPRSNLNTERQWKSCDLLLTLLS